MSNVIPLTGKQPEPKATAQETDSAYWADIKAANEARDRRIAADRARRNEAVKRSHRIG